MGIGNWDWDLGHLKIKGFCGDKRGGGPAGGGGDRGHPELHEKPRKTTFLSGLLMQFGTAFYLWCLFGMVGSGAWALEK